MNQAIDITYWLGVATWFGGVLFVAVAAPVIFRIVRERDPSLRGVGNANLDGQHASLLSGDILDGLLSLLRKVWGGCAVLVGIAIVLQWTVPPIRPGRELMLLRICLWGVATAVLIYDAFFVAVKARHWRNQYIEQAEDPDTANAALEHFDRYSKESVVVLAFMLFALLGLIFFGVSGDYQEIVRLEQ